MMEECEKLTEEIHTLRSKLQALKSMLSKHNQVKPRTRQERPYVSLCGYIPGATDRQKEHKFPSEKIKLAYSNAIETIDSIMLKRDRLKRYAQTAKGQLSAAQELNDIDDYFVKYFGEDVDGVTKEFELL